MNSPAAEIQSIDIFPWNEHFQTGLPEVDEQHRRLVDLLNRLAGHVAYNGTSLQFARVLEELKDYTVYHFRTEEAIWAGHLADDPEEARHRQVHHSFIETIERIEAQRDLKPSDQLIRDTLGFLAKWLASHILETDKRMAFVVQGLQAGLSLDAAKREADGKMSGETRSLIDLILSIYGTLATNTVQLMREIAAHKEANEALRASEFRYHASIDASPIPMALIDDQDRILYLNTAFSKSLGYNLPDIPALAAWWPQACPDPAYREWIMSTWGHRVDEARQEKRPFRPLEVTICTKGGAERIVQATVSPLLATQDGQHLITLYDVTESRQAEEALAASEMRFRALVEASAQIVWECDAEGSVVKDSPSWRAYTGQTYDEWSGLGYVEAIWPADREAVLASWRHALAEKTGSVTNTYRLRHHSGEWRWNRATAVPIRDRTGMVVSWVGTCTDIHEFQLNQMELEEHRHDLEKLVERRTVDLEVAKEAAESASRAKTAFLSIASHELRTPMSGIMGMLAIAMRKTDDPELLGHLGKADRASRQLLAVINDVLDISRIESNRLTLASTDFSPDEIRTHVLDALDTIAADKGLRLDYRADPALEARHLIGDPVRLTQILINLVGNALKFTARGEVSVSLGERPAHGEGMTRLRFEVRDTGIGIRREDLDRIFEPFEQVDDSGARLHGGTGLGLALCKRLAEAMDGAIGVDSTPGQGSLFWVEVEMENAGSDALRVCDDNAAGGELLARYRGTSVLLAEDEPLNREIAQDLLEAVGLEVFSVSDGRLAVESARSAEFDLILMDMNMPHLDGIEATREIRRMPWHGETPIIAMTANAFAEDRDACILAGMSDHIGKPVIPEVLYRTILRWLDRGTHAPHPAGPASGG